MHEPILYIIYWMCVTQNKNQISDDRNGRGESSYFFFFLANILDKKIPDMSVIYIWPLPEHVQLHYLVTRVWYCTVYTIVLIRGQWKHFPWGGAQLNIKLEIKLTISLSYIISFVSCYILKYFPQYWILFGS